MNYYFVVSIKDIKKGIFFVNIVWDIKFIQIEDVIYDLNNIEYGIIWLKFKDFCIYFVVNCVFYFCFKLLNVVFIGEKFDQQLDQVMRDFLVDMIKNIIKEDEV